MNNIPTTIAFAVEKQKPSTPEQVRRLALDLAIVFRGADVDALIKDINAETSRRAAVS